MLQDKMIDDVNCVKNKVIEMSIQHKCKYLTISKMTFNHSDDSFTFNFLTQLYDIPKYHIHYSYSETELFYESFYEIFTKLFKEIPIEYTSVIDNGSDTNSVMCCCSCHRT